MEINKLKQGCRVAEETRGRLDIHLKNGDKITNYLVEQEEINIPLQPNSVITGFSEGTGLAMGYRSNDVNFIIFDINDKRDYPPEINGQTITELSKED